MPQQQLEVGIVGAGIGGLMCSIAIARAGGKVTILEAAPQLGEIGAGIQMTPNVSRLLIRYGVDKIIGRDLVDFIALNLRRKDGTRVGCTEIRRVETATGSPWWLVHRHHLHNGLVEVAKSNGVTIFLDSRVKGLEELDTGKVLVTTMRGEGDRHKFDLVVGSDGLQSTVRQHLFPDIKPSPPTTNCAYRAIVPIDQIRNDPLTRELVEDQDGNLIRTMEVWMAPTGYIISYPISDGKDFNMVLSHFHSPPAHAAQPVDIEEVWRQYEGYDPRIRRVIEKISHEVRRWPLLVTGPLPSWSNAKKNIVLIGDAAHSMTNHMAQGAATALEDGAYLARCLGSVTKGQATISDAVALYEKGRMPKASYKQQLSFLNGWLWHLPDGPAQEARDRQMACELEGKVAMRSPNLYGDPRCVHECYGYDAEQHADVDMATWLNNGRVVRDSATTVEQFRANEIANWFLPEEYQFKIRPRL